MDLLIERIKNILLTPKETWGVIKDEDTSRNSIAAQYLLYLIAIPVISNFFGQVFVGLPLIGASLSFWGGIWAAILIYIAYFLIIVVGAFVLNALSPRFGGSNDNLAAFKLVAFSYTSIFVAGVLFIVPTIAQLGMLVGVGYAIYLFYLGLPVLLQVPEKKVLSLTIVFVIANLLITTVIFAIVSAMYA